MSTLYDPPGGWKYGFPKEWPEDKDYNDDTALAIQLLKDGYPLDDIHFGVGHCRLIFKEPENRGE